MRKIIIFVVSLILLPTFGQAVFAVTPPPAISQIKEESSSVETIKSIFYPASSLVKKLNGFKIKDEFTDVADLGNGKAIYRFYQTPRILEKGTDGELKVRPEGWNLFNETPATKLRDLGKGYQYQVSSGENELIQIQSGNYEVKEKSSAASSLKIIPDRKNFKQFNKEGTTVTEYGEVYPGVTVRFKDIIQNRFKEIVIEKKPQQLNSGSTIIFWEEYKLTKGIKISTDKGKELADGLHRLRQTGIQLHFGSGEILEVSGALVFDATDSDAARKDLATLVDINKKEQKLRVGIEIDADYLLAKERAYPVTIDPLYSLCKGVIGDTSCIVDLYLRYLTSREATTGDLFLGFYDDPTGPASRVPVVKFPNIKSQLPPNSTIDSATLNMIFSRFGLGNWNGSVTTVARKINTDWTLSNITYQNIRNTLLTVSPQVSVSNSPGTTYSWSVTSAVRDWYQGLANYGLAVEPVPAWLSGAKPSWPNRLYIFSSSRNGNGKGPYLDVNVTILKPDLTDGGGGTLNKTTISPGETLSASINIKNAGNVNSGLNTDVYYYFEETSRNFTYDRATAWRGYTSLYPLQPGATVTHPFSFTVPPNTPAGQYYFYWWLDAPGIIDESNESNNAWRMSQVVTVSQPKPDLTYSNQSINPTTVNPGGAVTVGATVVNSGNANTNVATQVDYFWNGSKVGQQMYQPLAAGQSIPISNIISIPSNTAQGTYKLRVVIDPLNAVAEGNENNNFFEFDVTIVRAQTIDLVVSDFNIDNSHIYYSGDRIQVSVPIGNNGSRDANNVSYELKIKDIGTNTWYALESLSPAQLNVAGNSSQTLALSGTIPANVAYQQYYIVSAALDPGGTISETNENNNTAYSTATIFIERWNFGGGGGGGGGTPQAFFDSDKDSFPDIAEKTGGTNPMITESRQLYDPNLSNYLAKFTDPHRADPVNLRTGGFEFTYTDFELPARAFPIKFTRVYNSKTSGRSSRLGNGWTHSYQMFYYQDPVTKNAQVYLGGAVSSLFITTDGGQTYESPPGEYDMLKLEGGNLVYKTLDGVRYVFSKKLFSDPNGFGEMGMLEQIIDPSGNISLLGYTVVRDVPLLSSITDPSGRRIVFTYPASTDAKWDKIAKLQETVNTTTSRETNYIYDVDNNLIRVEENRSYEGNTEKFTHAFSYDSVGRMTSYTDPRGTILYNEYDSLGQVTSQYEYNPRIDAPGSKRVIYEIAYQGPDPAIQGSVNCNLAKSFRNATNFWSERFCFNADQLKIYRHDGESGEERWEYDARGLVTKYQNARFFITNYQYDSRRRLTLEIPPDTEWHTEISYAYEDNFNRLTAKTERATYLADPAIMATKVTTYVIDSSNGNILSITDPLQNIESFSYESGTGNLLSHTKKNNVTTVYGYDPAKNYVETESVAVLQADGSQQVVRKEFKYNEYGKQIFYKDPRGFSYTYKYDTAGNLRQETNPDMKSAFYEYDSENHRIKEIDELGRITIYTFDTDTGANLTKIEKQGRGGPIIFRKEYDFTNSLIKEIDPLNREISYGYDKANRLTRKTDPMKTVNFIYEPDGLLKEETNTVGQKTQYVYDSRGYKTEMKSYINATDFVRTRFAFDGFSRLVSTTDGNGWRTSVSYDALDRAILKIDARNGTTTYSYDAMGNKTGEVAPRAFSDPALKNSFGQSASFFYDGLNRLIMQQNAEDKASSFFYDPNGNLIKAIDRANSDGTLKTHVMEYVYDSLNRKTTDKFADGTTIDYGYDAINNLTSKTDQAKRTWTYVYDDFDRLEIERDPDQNPTEYIYDLAGNKTAVKYPDTTQTRFRYDPLNHLTHVIDEHNKITEYTYNGVGNKLSEKNKRNFTITFVYDGLNRLVSETNAANTETTYIYDNNNNRLSRTTGVFTTQYRYDSLNRLTQITHPGDKTENFNYDADGNRTAYIDGENKTITYEYDALGRLTIKHLPQVVARAHDITYAYDNWNNLTRVFDDSGTTEYIYNSLNRITTQTKTFNSPFFGALEIIRNVPFVVQRDYAPDGQLKKLTDAAGKIFDYSYDNRGLLESVSYGSNQLARYAYTKRGKVDIINYGNGVVTNYNYDILNRPDSIEIKGAAGSSLWKQNYEYDEENNRTKLIQDGTNTINYTYDPLDQLETAGRVSFTYDKYGNRLSATNPLGSVSYTYNSTTNELDKTSFNLDRFTITPRYNGNGSVWSETYRGLGGSSNRKIINYTWTAENRPYTISISQTHGPADTFSTASYKWLLHDDFGNLNHSLNALGERTTFLYSQDNILHEIDNYGAITKSIVNGLDKIGEFSTDGSFTFMHQDVLGSTVLLTNQAGEVAQKYEYDEFGSIIGKAGARETRYLFTGQQYDLESDLYYLKARFYDPRAGRFISRDPVAGFDGDLLSRNAYIYAKNNPFKYVDINGLFAWGTFWEGVKQTAFGALQTAFGAAEVSAGAAIATGGTATGIGAVPGIVAGVAVAGLGVNNVVAGGTQTASGLTNIRRAFKDEEAVDYTYNPAHEAIDAVVPEGAGNTAAHIGFDVVDFVAGGAGIAKAGKLSSVIPKSNVPNPGGKLGGPAHREKVAEVAQDIKNRGMKVVKEYKVNTPQGMKTKRFADVAAINEEKVVELHQIGKQTKGGLPVSREVQAMEDIYNAKGIKPIFHPYNSFGTPAPNSISPGLTSIWVGQGLNILNQNLQRNSDNK